MSDGRHGKDEPASVVAWLRARIERVTAERDLLAEHLAAREKLDEMTFSADLPVTAGEPTGPHRAEQYRPVPPPRRPASHARTPKEARWLKVVRDTAQGVVPVGALAMFRPLAYAFKTAPPMVKAASVGVALTTAAAVVAVSPASPVSPWGASTSQVPSSVPGRHPSPRPRP